VILKIASRVAPTCPNIEREANPAKTAHSDGTSIRPISNTRSPMNPLEVEKTGNRANEASNAPIAEMGSPIINSVSNVDRGIGRLAISLMKSKKG